MADARKTGPAADAGARSEDYLGKDMPKLGFGLMRLPRLEDGTIDVAQTKDMVDAFMGAGLTYFDTAFAYEGSEAAAREALVERYPRDSFTLASKVLARQGLDADAVRAETQTSLERSGAGYFDYYLVHAVQSSNIARYDEFGIWDYVRDLKERGLVRHYGFSFHDTPEMLDDLLDKHPDVEFVQLQLNYADWENPAVQSRANYEVARRHGKPVVVMEPVKGGTLANPPESVARVLREADPDASLASWAIRFVASLEGIVTVLSGMSTLAQVEDNVSYMRDFEPLDADERAAISRAQAELAKIESIPCTGCHYCTPGCPQGIPIPEIFSAFNRKLVFGQEERARREYASAVEGGGSASDCIGCLQCEDACPQSLPVTEWLGRAAAEFEA